MQPKYYGAAANYNKPSGGMTGLSGILKIFGIFVGVVILLAIAYSIVTGISKGPQDNLARLVAREKALQTLLEKQKTNIRSGDLRTVNASAHILTVGDAATANRLLASVYGAKEVPKEITAAETDATLETTLKNAVLVGTFDKTYVDVLREKIAASYSLAQTVSNAANNKELKTATQHMMNNLSTIDTQLEQLDLSQTTPRQADTSEE